MKVYVAQLIVAIPLAGLLVSTEKRKGEQEKVLLIVAIPLAGLLVSTSASNKKKKRRDFCRNPLGGSFGFHDK